MNGVYYLLGAMACIAWRWMRWLSSQPAGTPLKAFWGARFATNVSSFIISMVMMGAYLSGAMGMLVRAIVPNAIDKDIPPMYQEAWAAPIAGFAITFAARKIVGRFADKIGETEEEK